MSKSEATLVAHPIASLFPLMEKRVFEELCEDISKNGLINPIVTFDGMILDGRNRELACESTGVGKHYVRFEDMGLRCEPWEYVAAQNLKRRDLTPDQRAMIVRNLEEVVQTLREEAKERQRAAGGDRRRESAKAGSAAAVVADSPQAVARREPTSTHGTKAHRGKKTHERTKPRNASTRARLAKIANVSEHKVRLADQVKKAPKCEELETEVIAGTKTLAQAAREASPPQEPELFGPEAESRRHIELIECSFEGCPVELRQDYEYLLHERWKQMWQDRNWESGTKIKPLADQPTQVDQPAVMSLEVTSHVTKREAVTMHGSNGYYSRNELKAICWTDALIDTILGKPDKLDRNPVFKRKSPMQLYAMSRVEAAQLTPEFSAAFHAGADTGKRLCDVQKFLLRADVPDPLKREVRAALKREGVETAEELAESYARAEMETPGKLNELCMSKLVRDLEAVVMTAARKPSTPSGKKLSSPAAS